MPGAFDIDHLDIDGDRAILESLKGKRVGRLVVHVHRPDDAQYVASCKSVDRFELWGWKGPDLTALQGLAVRYLRLVRGEQTSVKGLNTNRLKKIWLHACGKLRELHIPRLPWLWVWACNNLDLDSLASVRGLVGLDIGPQRREIRSLEFVAHCRYLKCLMIDAHSWKVKDFRPLVRPPALKLACFNGGLRPASVEAISRANPRLFIAVGNRYMQGGRPMTEADYLKRRRAFNKEYGV
jgi:hypothetical protein